MTKSLCGVSEYSICLDCYDALTYDESETVHVDFSWAPCEFCGSDLGANLFITT